LIRKPVVAGQFYPAEKSDLIKQIEQFIDKNAKKIDAKGAIMPHAAYEFSGFVAGQTVSKISSKDTYIMLGPNHRGYGEPFSIMTEGSWQTPLGEVKIDSDLAKEILKQSNFLKEDSIAHLYEHSIEVELPFLQYFNKDFSIVPITVFPAEIKIFKEIAASIAKAIEQKQKKEKVTIIASSDMTHYESQKKAEAKDKQAISAVLELDDDKLFKTVKDQNISMCGYAPAVIMLVAAKLLGAKKAKLIKYQTSGDASGDYSSVVGYAGVIIN